MATNPYVNKVTYDGTDLIDLTSDTVAQGDVLSGKYFHLPTGERVQGTIATKTSSNMTVSGATVTAPAGYYASNASKSVASGSATAPATISGSSATVSTGTNTLTLTKTVSVTPSVTAGYVSSGTAGNSSVSLTASVTTKGATTYTPTTTDQTIASGTYLTGTQTIKGDSNLVAGNIKSGVTIFNIAGSYQGTDVSDTTATADKVLTGYYFYNSSGVKTEGTAVLATATVSGTVLTLTNGFPVSV